MVKKVRDLLQWGKSKLKARKTSKQKQIRIILLYLGQQLIMLVAIISTEMMIKLIRRQKQSIPIINLNIMKTILI